MKRPLWLWISGTLFLLIAAAFILSRVSSDETAQLSADEVAWIKSHPDIRFAPDPDYPPVEYFDSNGRYVGITADYLALLEKKIGLRFRIVRLANWDDIISSAKSGRIDAFFATHTPQRSAYMLFTKPFVEYPAVIITREKVRESLSMKELGGMRISVVSEYAAHNFIAYNYPKTTLDVVPDIRTGLQKVSFGLSDALVESIATASYFIEREGISNLRIAGESGYVYRMGFATRKDWPILNRILSKGMAQIHEKETKAVIRKWITLEPDSPFTGKRFRIALITAFGVSCAVIVGFIAWNRALTGQVRLRTAELERELAERRQLEESLLFTQYAIDKAAVQAFWMTPDAHLFYVNDAACCSLGYTRQELCGMSIPDIDPDFPSAIFEKHWQNIRENGPVTFETRHRASDGRIYPVEIRANHVVLDGREYNCAFATDITERKRIENELRLAHTELEKRVTERTAELADTVEALRESETRLKIAMDLAKLVQWEYDVSSGMFIFDDQFYSLYGTTAGNEGGVLMSAEEYANKFLPREEHAIVKAAIKQTIKSSINQLEHRIIRGDGEERFVVVRGAVIRDKDGRAVKIQGANQDITERKRAQEQLKRKKELLETLNSTLERRVRDEVKKNQEKDFILIRQNRQAALGEALDHIAHQWKQPISSLYLLNYMLGDACENGELTNGLVHENVKTTRELLEHMTHTIDVFRDFYRPEKQQSVFSIKHSIETALSFIAPALGYHSIKVECDIEPELSAVGYPKEYAQVLLNILGNAKETFVERKPEKPKLVVRGFSEGEWAVVTITDNAGGIPEQVINNIFDLYFTTKETSGGTGIGLYMSRTIIENNMGGKLCAANVSGGAQFRIAIKARDIPDAA